MTAIVITAVVLATWFVLGALCRAAALGDRIRIEPDPDTSKEA